MRHPIDIAGQRYGRLVAVSLVVGARRKWLCRCDCGKEATINQASLRGGHSSSCGCLALEVLAERNSNRPVHGHRNKPTWRSWRSMKWRCLNPNAHAYNRYGGAGVTVCERWMKFENFVADMGPRLDGTTLDRIDNAKGYEPGNCRWATVSEQNKNRRSHGGRAKMCAA